MGSNGASGSDAGFFNSERVKEKKANQSLVGTSDYQGQLDAKPRQKKTQVGGNGDGNQIVQSTTTPPPVAPSPTVAEVSQSTTTDAEDPYLVRKRRTMARGRSQTIITSSQGVNQNFTLGKKSLLGRA